jgi:PilZ domain
MIGSMESHPQPTQTSNRRTPSANDRRDTDRIQLEDLSCNRGEILDFSSTGARLNTRLPWRAGKSRSITISTSAEQLTFQARCVWSMREGLFHHTVGVHFENVSTEQAQSLAELSRDHGQRTLGLGYDKAA